MIIVNVPVDESDAMRDAIGKAGGGKLGNYSFCSFSVSGIGRSLPNMNANPTIGVPGHLEMIDEERIEVSCDEADAREIVRVIRKTSTYEEPAVFVYPLIDVG
ncbi:hypothetical protein EPN95_02630 [Patescibacteria group bacterium]|nr:MAG: hypothetical protein EPN95_02630 [Patescibacteria group bacterium]